MWGSTGQHASRSSTAGSGVLARACGAHPRRMSSEKALMKCRLALSRDRAGAVAWGLPGTLSWCYVSDRGGLPGGGGHI